MSWPGAGVHEITKRTQAVFVAATAYRTVAEQPRPWSSNSQNFPRQKALQVCPSASPYPLGNGYGLFNMIGNVWK
jgi:formylglycine-generating enzyme required for sulfatase activity